MPGTVRLGSTGTDALLCQQCLRNAGYYPYKLDGQFGPYSVGSATKRTGLKGFQIKTGHTADGICGAKTWPDLLKYKPADPTPTPSPTRTVGAIQTACEKLLGQFNTLTEFANKCRGRGYGNYMNDVKTLEQEYSTIANLNCTDSTQLLIHLGQEMGYECHYVHIKCLGSGSGHVIAKVQGKEFANYTYIDLAAMMSTKTLATIGHGWCFDAIPVNARVDPSWLTNPDDGRT